MPIDFFKYSRNFILAGIFCLIPILTFAQQNTGCLEHLKTQMKNKEIGFQNSPLSGVDDAFDRYNHQFSNLKNKVFIYDREASSSITQMSVRHTSQNAVLEYALIPTKRSTSQYILLLKYSKTIRNPNFRFIEIEQTFKVSYLCEALPLIAKKTVLSKLQKGRYKLTFTESFYNEKDQSQSKILTTPDESDILNEKEDFNPASINSVNSNNVTEGYVFMNSDAGILYSKYTDLASEWSVRYSTLSLILLRSKKVQLFLGPQEMASFTLKLNEKEDRGQRNLPAIDLIEHYVSESEWFHTYLSSEESPYKIESDLTDKDFTTDQSLKIRVHASEPLSYPHLSAYWSPQPMEASSPWKNSYLMTEAWPISIRARPATSEELIDTPMLQYNGERIQSIVQEILSQSPKTREEKVRLILEKINSLIKYDIEGTKNNSFRPLKSEQILESGKGVCQHYSILFVALARAMNVPATIISGYFLGEKTGINHVWVEYEKEPGLWLPLDPQRQQTAMIRSHHYLPLFRNHFLEIGTIHPEDFEDVPYQIQIQKIP